MKNEVREIFLGFYELFDSVTLEADDSSAELSRLQIEIESLIDKSVFYNLLEIENCEIDIHTTNSSTKKNVLTSILSKIIIDNLYSLHITKYQKQNYFEQRLVSILTQLDYNEYLKIFKVHEKFLDDSLFSTLKISYLKYSEEYFYKVRALKPVFSKPIEDYDIDEDKFQIIKDDLTIAIQNYNTYIQNNYPTIRELFSYYNKDIRLYILDAPKNGSFTCKLLSYENHEKLNVQVFWKVLTLANRLGNIEGIEKDLSSSLLSVYDLENPSNFLRHFDIRGIHFELLQNYLKVSEKQEIFLLLLYIFSLNKTEVSNIDYNNTSFTKIVHDRQIMVKCHFEKEIDTKQILSDHDNFEAHIFLTRPDETILRSLNKDKINYFSQYVNQKYNLDAIHYFIKDNLKKELNPKQSFGGAILLKRLTECECGKKDWSKFEDICIEIFGNLFQNGFRNYTFEKQSNTESGFLRRDLIINNLPKEINSFWGDIKSSYGSNLIICEFKNYSEPLNSSTLYSTTKYINNQNRFILIFSRHGLDESARQLQLRLIKERNMLILVLKEDDIKQMMNEKELNINPLYRLENLKFELEKQI
jgi:hypothetical protein